MKVSLVYKMQDKTVFSFYVYSKGCLTSNIKSGTHQGLIRTKELRCWKVSVRLGALNVCRLAWLLAGTTYTQLDRQDGMTMSQMVQHVPE